MVEVNQSYRAVKTAELIYNPEAGNNPRKAGLVGRAESRLREHGVNPRRRRTKRPGHATELAQDASLRGVDVAIAVGGDGTLNEVGRGLLYSNTVASILPQGTENVFAEETGIPKKPEAAIDALVDGEVHIMDAVRLRFLDGESQSHEFFLMAGIGYDGKVFDAVQKPGTKRKTKGKGIYYWQAVKQLKNADTPGATLIVDGEEFKIDHLSQMWINNTQNVAFLRLRPDARADDGKMAVTIFDGRHENPKHNVLSLGKDLVLKLLGRRRLAAQEIRLEAEKLLLKLDRPLFVEVDGEPIGSGREIEIVVLKDALRVLTPKGTDIFSKEGVPFS